MSGCSNATYCAGECSPQCAGSTWQCSVAGCTGMECAWGGPECECSPGCHASSLGDSVCDAACNTSACKWDLGDCSCYATYASCYTDYADSCLCDAVLVGCYEKIGLTSMKGLAVDACEDVDHCSAMHCAGKCNAKCSAVDLYDAECTVDCTTPACHDDRGQCGGGASSDGRCAAECLYAWNGDGVCDAACNVSDCAWDGDDCFFCDAEKRCPVTRVGDGVCDEECNVESCGYDGGDCYVGCAKAEFVCGRAYAACNRTDCK
jgi:hypothetical protein